VRLGFRHHYEIAPWSDYVEVHWGAMGQIYVTPVSRNCVCIVYVTRYPASSQRNFIDSFPAIAQKLGNVPMCSRPKGAPSITRRLRRITDHEVVLVGDSSGSVDAITGEGLALAFRQSIALAPAIKFNNLDTYTQAHKRISRLPRTMGKLMLLMDKSPQLQSRAMKVFSSSPSLFRQLVSVHVGAQSFHQFALRRGPQLGWKLLRASSL
jgi:2-polyprenyl-6-methoxyphenol hydroxylase-like FAD-dependent oxidoreductase